MTAREIIWLVQGKCPESKNDPGQGGGIKDLAIAMGADGV